MKVHQGKVFVKTNYQRQQLPNCLIRSHSSRRQEMASTKQSCRYSNACQGVDGLLPTEFSVQNSKLAYQSWKRREKPLNGNLCSIKEYRKNLVNRQSAEKDQQSLESRNEMKISSQSQSSFTKWKDPILDGTLLKALNRVAGEYVSND